jgi:hypothetical protein
MPTGRFRGTPSEKIDSRITNEISGPIRVVNKYIVEPVIRSISRKKTLKKGFFRKKPPPNPLRDRGLSEPGCVDLSFEIGLIIF